MCCTLLLGLERLKTSVKVFSKHFHRQKEPWHLGWSFFDSMYLISKAFLHFSHKIEKEHLFSCSLNTKYTNHSLIVHFLQLEPLLIPFCLSLSFQKRKPNISSSFNSTRKKVVSKLCLVYFEVKLQQSRCTCCIY